MNNQKTKGWRVKFDKDWDILIKKGMDKLIAVALDKQKHEIIELLKGQKFAIDEEWVSGRKFVKIQPNYQINKILDRIISSIKKI